MNFAAGLPGIGDAVDSLFGAIGAGKEAKGMETAAKIADENARLAAMSSQIQQVQSQRAIYQGLGGQKADVAGAGFASSGSALDLLRSSAQQGALERQMLRVQGLINVQSYQQEAAAYRAQSQAAKAKQKGGFLSTALNVASAAFAIFSDEDTKEDIRLVGPSNIPGINTYVYRYKGDNTIWHGVLAQEVQQARPDAVVRGEGGLLKVDYDKLGIELKNMGTVDA